MQDGLWWDIYCDPVIEHLSNIYKCVLLESPYLNAHLTPSKTKNIKYLDLPVFLAGLLRRTKLIRFSLSKYEQNIIGEIQNIIEKNFNIHFDEFPVLLLNQLYFRKSIFSFYTWILKKSRPKIVVVICGYGNKIFIEACHKLSIPVVELQHGSSVGRYHIGYSFPKKHDNEIRFPDYLLTFGDFWKNRSEYPIGSEKIFSVGYPFFEIEVSKYKNIKKRHQIIFISQGTIGHTLSAFAVQLNSIKNFSYKIIYKLHPGEYSRWRKEYPWLVGSGIEVIEDDKKSLYCLLSESKIQIGVYSTAIYEGLGFGLKTFLINLPGIEYMHELIEYGAVTVVTNVSKLVEQLDKPTQNKVLSEFFLKNNSLENIKDCLRKIFDQTSLS